jgi:hypothetical protein
MNRRNIGASTVTDYLTPLRFSTIRIHIRNIAKSNLKIWNGRGRKLKIASEQAAIDTVMVRT